MVRAQSSQVKPKQISGDQTIYMTSIWESLGRRAERQVDVPKLILYNPDLISLCYHCCRVSRNALRLR